MLEISGLLAIAGLTWLWFDSLRAREAAVQAARTACAQEGLLFLDDTVKIASLRLARDDAGRVRMRRVYDFEYSDSGNNRIKGNLVLLGHEVTMLNIGLRLVASTPTLH